MAYRELSMIEVREALRRWQAQQGVRQIARETGIDRKTARRYVDAATRAGIARDGELTDAQVLDVKRRVRPKVGRPASAAYGNVAKHRERIAQWLDGPRALRLRKVHVLLRREGVRASYDTLRRFAMKELGWRKCKSTVRLDDPPAGQQAQVDFARMGLIPAGDGEPQRVLWVLLVTLTVSRYMFVWPTFVQTLEALCEGLDAAWSFFGAMPRTIVPDNMRAIVARPDSLEPKLSDGFSEYAQHRGLLVDPARVMHPRDKARVENQVPYVRENWFAGETFRDLADARRSAAEWCRDVAGARVHGTTRLIPREQFETVERPAMLPAPEAPFDVPRWCDAKVHPDHHIQVAHALYSVPSTHLHSDVRVRIDSKQVKIYSRDEVIKVHPRVGRGDRSTDVNDYPRGTEPYVTQSLDWAIAQARKHGEHVGEFVEHLLDVPLPWARLRGAQAVVRFCSRYGAARVDAACKRAIDFGVINVRRVEGMLQRGQLETQLPLGAAGVVIPIDRSAPRFARDPDYFKTRRDDEDGAR